MISKSIGMLKERMEEVSFKKERESDDLLVVPSDCFSAKKNMMV
jgi:hypothetical protein